MPQDATGAASFRSSPIWGPSGDFRAEARPGSGLPLKIEYPTASRPGGENRRRRDQGRIERPGATGKPRIFTGDPKLQVVWDFPSWEISPITDLTSATNAINFIVEQGEGTTHSPMDDLARPGELAHYYRFAEIVMAKKIVADPHAKSGWSYGGDPIPFDPLKITPVIADPKASSYPAGSTARYGCDTFNYTYMSLLKVLHETFNGHPIRLGRAIGMMESLKEQALTLMTIDSGLGGKAGPSFEYQPTNP